MSIDASWAPRALTSTRPFWRNCRHRPRPTFSRLPSGCRRRHGARRSRPPWIARCAPGWGCRRSRRSDMPAPGDLVALEIEKPAAGARMLARLDGQILFVSGTIPGEHVTARVEFVRGGVVFARAESVDVWSPARGADGADRDCGGNDYAHILYGRQLTLKRDLVEDAFSRIAKLPLPADVRLHASPERGYRMRARLHVDAGQVGFYRQASHDL